MVQSIVDFLLLIFWGLKHEILPVTGNQTKDQILRNEQYPFFQTVQFRALNYIQSVSKKFTLRKYSLILRFWRKLSLPKDV